MGSEELRRGRVKHHDMQQKSLPSGGLFLFCIAAADGARCGNCKKYYVQNPIKFPTFAADENLSRWNSLVLE